MTKCGCLYAADPLLYQRAFITQVLECAAPRTPRCPLLVRCADSPKDPSGPWSQARWLLPLWAPWVENFFPNVKRGSKRNSGPAWQGLSLWNPGPARVICLFSGQLRQPFRHFLDTGDNMIALERVMMRQFHKSIHARQQNLHLTLCTTRPLVVFFWWQRVQ